MKEMNAPTKVWIHVRKKELNEVWCGKDLKDIVLAMEWQLIAKLRLTNMEQDLCPMCMLKFGGGM